MPWPWRLLRATPSAGSPHRGAAAPICAVTAALCVAMSAPALADDPVVARVNGVEIHASDVAVAEEDIGSNLSQMPPGNKRDYVITYLADMMLVAKAAEDRKTADGDDFKRRLAYHRNKLLMEQLLRVEARAAITDEALRKLYDEAIKQMAGEKEVHARHILVETEAEAKAILAELKAGADFAELAKKKSKDPGGADGGDLGYFTREQMVPEFAEVAFRLEKGQISDPVKTQFGWHIIKVEDKRDRPIPEFEKVREELTSYLSRRAQVDLIARLRAEAKIERLDQPSPPSPAPESKKD